MATTNLNLDLPTPTVTLGPAWATQINDAFEVIDAHDHSSGKGLRVPTAGLNINDALDINDNALQNVEFMTFTQGRSIPTGLGLAGSVSIHSGNLYYTNLSGIAVQITDGGDIASAGGNAPIFETQNVSTNLTISSSDDFVVLIVDTSASRIINLPLASAVANGRNYIIKDASGQANTNPITINAQGSDTIDGQSSVTIDSNFASKLVVGDGSSSWVIS